MFQKQWGLHFESGLFYYLTEFSENILPVCKDVYAWGSLLHLEVTLLEAFLFNFAAEL